MVTRSEYYQITHPFDVLSQAGKVGGMCAVPGLAVGSFAGTLRTTTPVLFALVSGAQWFAIGTTFWTVRSSLLDEDGLRNWYNTTRGAPDAFIQRPGPPSPSEKIRASAISGSITGAVLGLVFRGPKNVIPGTIMFTLFGYGGQHAYNYFDNRNTRQMERARKMKEEGEKELNWLERVANKKWSPMSILTDDKYEELLKEKIFAVDVDIALIDDRIAECRQKQKEMEKAQAALPKEEKIPEKK